MHKMTILFDRDHMPKAKKFNMVVVLIGLLLCNGVIAQTINTVAGTGSAGFSGDGGLATSAQLNRPLDVFVDNNGNSYVGDYENQRIRKIDTLGNISTVLSGINKPFGLFVDPAGNIYFTADQAHRVYKIDTSNTLTTIAGTGAAGFSGDGGSATSAQLQHPRHIITDASGNLYITDASNHRIRKIDASGIISTVVGTGVAGFSGDGGPATNAQLSSPQAIAFDGVGNMYIADGANHRIRKVDTSGNINTVAGTGIAGYSGDGGPATIAQFTSPHDVILDSAGNFYIASPQNQAIRKVDTSGIISTVVGTGIAGYSGDGGPATSAQINEVARIAFDGVGDLYIADQTNHRIRKVVFESDFEISGQIVFTTERDGNYEIYVMNSDGSNPTNLTNDPALDYNPRWSPDRSKILFSSNRDGDHEIYVVDADGGNLVKLTDNTATEKNADWSPDGSQIVFDSDVDGDYDIYVMNADGSDVQNKTNNTVGNTNPRWSPDGTKIAFYSGLSSGVGIWTMSPDGSQLTELATSTSNTTLSWSPDGTEIAYIDHDGSDDELWKMDSDGNNKMQLTSNGIFDGSPAWSADGGAILYTSGAYGSNNSNFEIYRINPNGSNIIQLTSNAVLDTDSDWANFKHIGSVVAGNTASRTMQIKNTGDQTLAVSNISSSDAQFSAWPTSFSVAAGDSQAVDISFAPSAEGTQYATLSIFSNDPDQSQADIIINGIGTPCADPLTERLYAPLGDRLAIIDAATHAVSEIPLPAAAPYSSIRGLSQSWDGNTLLIVTNETASGVLLFDPSTETFGAFYPIASNPRLTAADFDGDMSHIFVVGQDGTLFVIDRSTGAFVTHGIPSQNFDGETAPDGSAFYAGSRDSGTLSVFDGATHAAETPWSGLPAGPHQIALNADGTRGYVTHEYAGSMSCLNMTDRTLIGTTGVGSHPIPIAISDDGQTVYVGNRDSNSISVIDANSCALTGTIPSALTGSNVHSLGYANGKIYAGGGAANINIYDALTLAPLGTIPLTTTVGGQHIFAVSSIEPVAVSLPDTSSLYAQSLTVPVRVENTSCKGVVSAEIFIAFDEALLTVNSVTAAGGLAAGWTLEHNVISGSGLDTLKIAMATDADTLAGSGALAHINFAVADLRAPAYSPLELTHALFNDGSPGGVKTDGSLTLVGTDGTLEHPVQVLVYPSDAIALVVTDPDENRSVAQRETLSVSVHNIYNGDIETMAMAEDGVSSSVFAGNIATVFSLSANSGDGQIQGKAGDPVVSIYIDSLDANGNTVFRADTTIFQGGFDGRLSSTVVAQPGDTVRVKVVDEDLSQWAFVSIENQRSGELGSALLQAFSPGSSVYYGRFFTDSAPSIAGDSTLSILDCDTLLITYNDQLTALGGTSVLTEQTNAVAPFGDANDDGSSGAFDAARTLLHVLSPYLQTWDTLSVNVDSLAPYSPITPYDASLILQKRVGLIDRFPVQTPVALNQPQPETTLQPGPKAAVDTRWLSLRPAGGYLSVWADELGGIVAGELLVVGVEGQVQPGEQWGEFMVKSRAVENGKRIVFAGAEAVSGPGELLRLYGVGPEGAQLVRAQLNDERIAVQVEAGPIRATPASYALYANVPNPFNPETGIRFDLPREERVRLEVYDVLGQQIRVLVAQSLSAGTHEFVWDGRDDRGRQVGSGMYLYRLNAGLFTQVKRMLLLK